MSDRLAHTAPSALAVADPAAVREQLAPHLPEVLARLAADAKAGDPQATRVFFQLAVAQARPESERVSVPAFADAATLQEKAEAIIRAAATGAISAEAAERLLRVLDVYSRAVKTDALEARLEAIESAQRGGRAPLAQRVDAPAPNTFDPSDIA